ncbi:hypothetical protein EV361DRAFT_808597, partial [Lentinula raphanica]
STRNNRIERLWVEVGAQFARRWQAFFQRLEILHGLDASNESHLWLLHYLFLDEINADCKQFCNDWNSHPISGEGHDQSPKDLRLLGRIEHGQYRDDCEGLDPAIIEKYYGVDLDEMEEDGESSADSDSGSDLGDFDDLEDRIAEDISSQLHHAPVPVPKHNNPFTTVDQQNLFHSCLLEYLDENIIPDGYSVKPEEWGLEGYPTFKILKSGRRGTKELRIPLPIDDWLPRAELWVQALSILTQIQKIDN